MATAIVSAWDAMGTAISAGSNPPAELPDPRFYRDGEVPVNAPLGYYLLGQPLEDPAGFINQPGNSGSYTVHCWASTLARAARLYTWLEGLLHGSRLPVTGHTVWRCSVRAAGSGRDADSNARQIIARVDMDTVVA